MRQSTIIDSTVGKIEIVPGYPYAEDLTVKVAFSAGGWHWAIDLTRSSPALTADTPCHITLYGANGRNEAVELTIQSVVGTVKHVIDNLVQLDATQPSRAELLGLLEPLMVSLRAIGLLPTLLPEAKLSALETGKRNREAIMSFIVDRPGPWFIAEFIEEVGVVSGLNRQDIMQGLMTVAYNGPLEFDGRLSHIKRAE